MTGHSSGEIAAAYAAGALTLESAMSIAYFRGLVAANLNKSFPAIKGAMLAIGASSAVATSFINQLVNGPVVVACVNSPSSITASGDLNAIVELQQLVEEKGLFCRRLPVDVAYHSPHMEPIADEYRTAIGRVKPTLSKDVQFFSSLFGGKTSTLALGSSYWVNNLRSPVRFSESLYNLCYLDHDASGLIDSVHHIIEIGPHSALKGPTRDILTAGPKTKRKIEYSSILVRKENAVVSSLRLASELFMKGYPLNMPAINSPDQKFGKPSLLSDLPPYPWNHENKYWHESRLSRSRQMRTDLRNDVLGTLTATSNDIEPTWRNIIRLNEIPWVSGPSV